ncbi:NB-ARC domain-containing protein [Rugosimonospora acidiphila]
MIVFAAVDYLGIAVAGRYGIAAAVLVGVLLTHLALFLVRRRQLLAPPVVPVGLDHTAGGRRRQRIAPADLPPPPGPLQGRHQQLAQLWGYLSSSDRRSGPRVALISGGSGIGKTALATNVAHLIADDYPDGQLLVQVDVLSSIDDALAMLVRALAGPKDPVPERREDYGQWYRRVSLRSRLLIIFDDVSDFDAIAPLLPAGNRCTVIITSQSEPRSPQRSWSGLRLLPLVDDDATALLDTLIGGGWVAAEPEFAARVVREAHGYPMALHMAGTALTIRKNWTRKVAVDQMTAQPVAHGDVEQIAFPGILNLCFSLMTGQERMAAILLGLIDDGRIDDWILVALFEGSRVGSVAVTELVAKQLLDRLARIRFVKRRYDDSSGLSTFHMPAYVQAYVRAAASGTLSDQQRREALNQVDIERQQRARRSTEAYLRENVYQLLDNGELEDALNRSRETVALCRARASTRADDAGFAADEALTLAALAEVHSELGWIDEGWACAKEAVQLGAGSDHTLTRALRISGTLLRQQNLVDDALLHLHRALEVARRLDDPLERVRVLRELTVALAGTAELEDGLSYVKEAEAVCASQGMTGQRHLPGVLLARARVLRACGNQSSDMRYRAEASQCLADAERHTLRLPDLRLWRPWIRLEHALVALDAQEPDQSRTLGTSALDGFTALRHRYGAAHARLVIGRAYLADGSLSRAIVALEESHGTFRRCGDRWIQAQCALALADAYERAERADGAKRNERGERNDRVAQAIDLLSTAEEAFALLGDDENRRRATRRLWTVESGYPSEPLRLFTEKEQPVAQPNAGSEPGLSRPVSWPAPQRSDTTVG